MIRAARAESGAARVLLVVGSAVCGFLASGDSLVITSLGCSFLLIATILLFDRVRERVILGVPFVAAFAGALINALAPGNFIRAAGDVKDEHSGLLDAGAQVRESFSGAIVQDLRSGDMMRTYQLREYALGAMEMAEDGTDFVLYMPYGPKSKSMYSFGITTESSDFINESAANMFGLERVTIVYPE